MATPVVYPSDSIRDLADSDLADVSALAARVWRAHYRSMVSREQIEYMLATLCSPEAMLKQIQEKNQRFFVLEQVGAIAGYIALEPRTPGEWFLDKLYIDMDGQRHGHGHRLLAYSKKILLPRRITLRVNRANIHAINFYFKEGFVITGMDVKDIGRGYVMDDYLMQWTALS